MSLPPICLGTIDILTNHTYTLWYFYKQNIEYLKLPFFYSVCRPQPPLTTIHTILIIFLSTITLIARRLWKLLCVQPGGGVVVKFSACLRITPALPFRHRHQPPPPTTPPLQATVSAIGKPTPTATDRWKEHGKTRLLIILNTIFPVKFSQ